MTHIQLILRLLKIYLLLNFEIFSVCIISADKYTDIIVLKRTDYINKLGTVIHYDTESGTNVKCQNTIQLKTFHEFLRRNLSIIKRMTKKRPVANQLEPITVHLLRLNPVTNQEILRKILAN